MKLTIAPNTAYGFEGEIKSSQWGNHALRPIQIFPISIECKQVYDERLTQRI